MLQMQNANNNLNNVNRLNKYRRENSLQVLMVVFQYPPVDCVGEDVDATRSSSLD